MDAVGLESTLVVFEESPTKQEEYELLA